MLLIFPLVAKAINMRIWHHSPRPRSIGIPLMQTMILSTPEQNTKLIDNKKINQRNK